MPRPQLQLVFHSLFNTSHLFIFRRQLDREYFHSCIPCPEDTVSDPPDVDCLLLLQCTFEHSGWMASDSNLMLKDYLTSSDISLLAIRYVLSSTSTWLADNHILEIWVNLRWWEQLKTDGFWQGVKGQNNTKVSKTTFANLRFPQLSESGISLLKDSDFSLFLENKNP